MIKPLGWEDKVTWMLHGYGMDMKGECYDSAFVGYKLGEAVIEIETVFQMLLLAQLRGGLQRSRWLSGPVRRMISALSSRLAVTGRVSWSIRSSAFRLE